MPKPIKINDKVLLKGDHPWKNHTGIIIEVRKTPFGDRPIVKLDNGQTCFIMKPSQAEKLG